MKNMISLAICILTAAQLSAQAPFTPAGKPGQKNVPENLKPVTKADLSISAISLISATGGSSEWDIKIVVTIKNTGGLPAPASKLKVMAQNAAAASNPWKEMALLDLPAVKAGSSLTKEYRVYDRQWVMHKIPVFNLKLQADAAGQVDESAENNNESPVIRISSR